MRQPDFLMAAAYLAVLFTGYFTRRSRMHAACFVVLMASIAFFNTDAADFSNIYQSIYNYPELYRGAVDEGWLLLCTIGRASGVSYSFFAAVLAGFSSALILYVVWRISDNPSFFTSLYLIYPGLLSVVQFRQFVASSVAFLAVYVLSRKHGRSLVMFVILIFIAVSLHRTAMILAVLPLVQVYLGSQRLERLILGGLAVALVVVAIMNAEVVAAQLFGEFRTTAYLGVSDSTFEGSSFLGGVRNASLIILIWLLVRSTESILPGERSSGELDSFRRYTLFSNTIALPLIPFVFISTDFMRFERYAYSLSIADPTKGNAEREFIVKFLYTIVSLAFGYFLIWRSNYDTVVVPLLTFEYWPTLSL